MKQWTGRIKSNWNLIVLVLFALTPIIWFRNRPDVLINGSDTNFPLNPGIWFLRRFYTWTPIGNGGSDFSSSTAGTFFHLLQFIPYKLGFSLQHVELLSLLVWFFLIVFSSYLLSRLILPKRKIAQLIFVCLYSFNLYLFNTWENVKVSNLSLVAAIPLGLWVLILLSRKQISRQRAIFYSTFIGIILSGSGINPAYYLCFFLVIGIYFVLSLLVDRDREKIKTNAINFILILVFINLTNLFWIIPTLSFIKTNITASGSIDAIGYTNWLDSLSQNTSILNVLRLQGAWDWYSFDTSSNLPLYIPYAVNYFFRFPFLVFSFALPTLAFISLIVRKNTNRGLYLSFAFMLILGVFLGAGSHDPTGVVYVFLANHMPFFSLFRSPWYIFTPLVIISIGGLIGLLFSVDSKVGNSKYVKILSVFGLMIIVGNLIYNYPLIEGKIFRPNIKDNFYIKFPQYVFSTGAYLNEHNDGGRVVNYPDNEIERYSWGYNAVDSILELISNHETLFLPLTAPDSPVALLTKQLYQSFKRGEVSRVRVLAKVLNATEVLQKGDQETLSPVLPAEVKSHLVNSFGPWNLYSLGGSASKFQVTTNMQLAYPFSKAYEMTGINDETRVIVNPEDSVVKQINNINKDPIIEATNSQVTSLNTTGSAFNSDSDSSSVVYTFETYEDGTYIPVLERYKLESVGILPDKKISLKVDGNQVTWTVRNITDAFVYFDNIFMSKGHHTAQLTLNNINLSQPLQSNGLNNFNKNGTGTFTVGNDSNGSYLSVLNLSSRDISAVFPLKDIDFMSNYLISIKYQQIYGNTAAVMVDQGNKRSLVKAQTEKMPNYPELQNYSFYYQPVQTQSDMNIHLVAGATRDSLGSKVIYRDLVVKKIFSNNLYFTKSDTHTNQVAPQVQVNSASAVEYQGEVTNGDSPHILIFSDNYSTEWKISLTDLSGKPIDVKPLHFSGNLYANAWYIDGAPNAYKFRVYYGRQTALVVGYIGTGVTFGIAIILLLMQVPIIKRSLRK